MSRCVPLRPAGVGLALAGLMILCAGRRAEAAPIRPPAPLLAEIRRQSVANGGWHEAKSGGLHGTAEWPLDWSHYLLLKDGRLLLLLQIPDYMGWRSTAVLPVTIDRRGRWRWGTPLLGTLGQFGVAGDGSIWVACQWEVEYGEALVYRSSDGIDWKPMALPDGRATSRSNAEMLGTLCVRSGRVEVQVEGVDEKDSDIRQTWSRGLEPGAGGWKLEPQLSTECGRPRPPVSGCARDESPEHEVIFRCGGRSIALPKGLKVERPH